MLTLITVMYKSTNELLLVLRNSANCEVQIKGECEIAPHKLNLNKD